MLSLSITRLTSPQPYQDRVQSPAPARVLLDDLLDSTLVLAEEFDALPAAVREELTRCDEVDQLLPLLVDHALLTEYQAGRIAAGKTFGLVLGNYRILDRLGAGGMGIVFKGEHVDMRRLVAVKVLPLYPDQAADFLSRFLAEMRAVARLHHPNIVAAFDAGKAVCPDGSSPDLRYFVMEYVPGLDLEEHVYRHGPLLPARACDLAHQVASALGEAHKYQLVHRDIKPSNILVTPEEQAKLLDFGLTRRGGHRLTEPGTLLGTFDFMAPEQARDASAVDIRADIYGLGGTLFWCLTGQIPFEGTYSFAECLARRLTQPPPSVRDYRPELAPELDAVVARMMAASPDDRFATPREVMRTLLPFLKPESPDYDPAQPDLRAVGQPPALPPGAHTAPRTHRILIVDDEPPIREFCRRVLQAEGIQCQEVPHALAAVEAVKNKSYDLVLSDVTMPGMSGLELLRHLRESPPGPNLKIVMISGRFSSDEMTQMLLAGADDYLTKPFSMIQLQGRIKTILRLKDAQDRSELLNQHLLAVNAELERNLNAKGGEVVHARNALVLALAKLVEHRDIETGAHLVRLQRYCRCLVEEAARSPLYAAQITQPYVETLECCAPLHDIGKMGLPDHILLKPGKLAADERVLMQAHTIIGSDTLQEVARQHGFALGFLQMAIDITRHHHERYDGSGYPDRLAGNAIPLAARLVAIGDVYDALRSRRVYKPALSHTAAYQLMTEASPGQFDPGLLAVFQRCADRFAEIYQKAAD
jgi:response regulator RpfG family c-di-GMP phosphodiesterase/serine/threonine protein kinase